MTESFKIVGVGNPIVDSIARVDEAFLDQIEGDKGGMVLTDPQTIASIMQLLPEPPHVAPGGSAGNTLFALARMGVSARLVGKTGNCDHGLFYRKRFAELGGDSTRFKIGSVPNGHCLSLVTPDGERTMRTDLGAAMTLAPEEITTDDFAGCRHAHIEGYLLFNEALMRAVLGAVRASGCTVSLDLASFEVVHAANAILPELLGEYVDLVFANEEEAAALTGIPDDHEAMARALGRYCKTAAVKVGPRGCILFQDDELLRVPADPIEQLVDTTAAGDLWAAGFLYGWSRGRSLAECGRIGSMLGAAAVQTNGSVIADVVWRDILNRVDASPTPSH